jgi:NADH-quinone oxidoreductase subunit L
LVTAVYAYLTASVQTDIKSVLSFASLTQVGLIVAEIGLGAWIPFLWYVALVHLLGHACLRTQQFIRAPTLLQDYRHLEDAIGAKLQYPAFRWVHMAPRRLRSWLYRFALERGYLDAILTTFAVIPFVRLFRWLDRIDRRWTSYLAGSKQEHVPVVATRADPTLELARTRP